MKRSEQIFDKYLVEFATRYKITKEQVITVFEHTLDDLGYHNIEVDDNMMIMLMSRTLSYIVVTQAIASGNISNFEELLAYKLLGPKGELQ